MSLSEICLLQMAAYPKEVASRYLPRRRKLIADDDDAVIKSDDRRKGDDVSAEEETGEERDLSLSKISSCS